MSASFKTEGTYVPDALIAGNAHLLVARKVTIISGQNLVRGTVLGKITTGGKYNKSLSTASDGSQTPDMILAEDCDASAGDASALAYSRCDVNAGALTLGASHTVASITEGLRVKGIVIVPSIA
jgi:hypothetical protein